MSRLTLDAHRDAFTAGHALRVVNFHCTPRGGAAELERELAAYADRFAPVGLDDLDAFLATGEWAHDRPGLLPVFYEGYRTHAEVAAPACERAGLTGWFFVVTDFLDTPPAEQEAYARSHWIALVDEDLDAERIAMTWEQVGDLAERHVVASHTASHAGLDTVLTAADLEREVVAPKRRLEAVTGRPVRCFAWFNGTPYGDSPVHDAAVVDAGYDYLVSNTALQRLPSPA